MVYHQIGSCKYRAPEVLFQPDLIGEECQGIHDVLVQSIQKCDMDLRRTLYYNVVLSGGSTLLKGQIFITELRNKCAGLILLTDKILWR